MNKSIITIGKNDGVKIVAFKKGLAKKFDLKIVKIKYKRDEKNT